jgi:peptidoglycan hydrolase-like protein with peptidoglycan-binding domain
MVVGLWRAVLPVLVLVLGLGAWDRAAAQSAERGAWLQVEAHPSLPVARDRARSYTDRFPETAGFRLPSGWYVIALGPLPAEEARARLTALRRAGEVPADSFVTDGAGFREPFWPEVAAEPAPEPAPEATPEAAPEAAPAAAPEPVAEAAPPAPLPEETPDEARRSEAELSRPDRERLQTALAWYGVYTGGIDGAFGRGTRAAMAAWQEMMGLEPTGILTSLQRATLVANYEAEVAEFGFAPVDEAEAGIRAELPLGLVEFDHYEPPFVHFRETGGSGLRVVLISQPGDQGALYGLYDILQSLTDVPLEGERSRSERGFSIRGANATTDTTVEVGLRGGLIKGWMVVGTPANAARDARVIARLRESFDPSGTTALDPGMVPMDAAMRQGLLSGLEMRRPKLSQSGIFVDGRGRVVTAAAGIEGCARVTIDRTVEARVLVADAALGVALLDPMAPLAPAAVAAFQMQSDRPGATVALAGYSFGDRLPAPALTYGLLEAAEGLDGDAGVKLLTLSALPGDMGGPVVDGTGAVLGMHIPAPGTGARELPPEVAFAAAAPRIEAALAGSGVTLTRADGGGALPPEDLSSRARAMTALVSCWE